MKSAAREQIVVMGLGRSRHGDDGIGPAVLRSLRADFRPRADVVLVDGDRTDLDAEGLLARSCGVVMVGRVHMKGPPGALCVLRGHEIVSAAGGLGVSGHAATFLAPLARRDLLGAVPEESVLICVNGEGGHGADGMAPSVQMAVGPAVLSVELELARMGRPLTRLRRDHAFRDPWVRSGARGVQALGA